MPVDRIVSSVPFLIASALLMVVGLAACGRPPHLVDGPIEITDQPITIRFDRLAASAGPIWELCFEFDPPGDSRRAADIQATLLAAGGARAMLRNPSLDRQGESVVCQVGPLDVSPPGPPPGAFQGVELRSEAPLRLRGIRGGRRDR